MYYCIVNIKTQSSTFRIPEFQNFHKSYLLPPPTTIIGFAGAALGLDLFGTQEFFDDLNFTFGVYGISGGKTKDLWKFRKLKEKGFQSDILTREIFFLNEFNIVYGNNNPDKIDRLIESFRNPKYALTLGNSDSIAKITNISKFEKSTLDQSFELENCIVEGDIIEEVIENSSNELEFSIYTNKEPTAYDLPTKFSFDKNNNVRNIVKRKTFSFIGEKMTVNVNKQGLFYENQFIPLFKIR